MIYIFKTTIPDQGVAEVLSEKFSLLLSGSSWSFDLEDCDRIFRLEAAHVGHVKLSTQLIIQMGYTCVELEDLVLPDVNSAVMP